jgi:hypothetical protein
MKKVLGAIAVTAALAAVAGCGSGDEQEPAAARTPVATPAPTTSPEPAASSEGFEKGHSRGVREYYSPLAPPDAGIEAEYHQPPHPATGGIGDTITLTGTNVGVLLDVTVTGLADAATARRPRDGMRWVGVNLRMENNGIAIYDDILNDGLLRYGANGKARTVLGVKADCSHGLQRIIRIDVGRTARGCVLFEVPASARPRTFQLALEQVPAEAGGRWRLR